MHHAGLAQGIHCPVVAASEGEATSSLKAKDETKSMCLYGDLQQLKLSSIGL
jgi:hypothetical protein